MLFAIAALAVAWQIAALAAATLSPTAGRLAPTWQQIILVDLPGFASFVDGSQQSDYFLAFRVIGENAYATIVRVIVSLLLAFVIGTALGLLTMSSRISCGIIAPITRVVRNIPLLALVPLFLIWFGGEEYGVVAFITFGLSMICLTNTISAITTVDRDNLRLRVHLALVE